jgi:hypothetical protein
LLLALLLLLLAFLHALPLLLLALLLLLLAFLHALPLLLLALLLLLLPLLDTLLLLLLALLLLLLTFLHALLLLLLLLALLRTGAGLVGPLAATLLAAVALLVGLRLSDYDVLRRQQLGHGRLGHKEETWNDATCKQSGPDAHGRCPRCQPVRKRHCLTIPSAPMRRWRGGAMANLCSPRLDGSDDRHAGTWHTASILWPSGSNTNAP